MLIVDTHVHTGVNWSEPVEVLMFQMEANGVSHAVLIGHNGNYDNTYLIDCGRNYGNRFKFVALIDPESTSRTKNLEALHKQGAAGIRINLRKEKEWDPDDPVFRMAGDFGMIISIIGKAENFASARFKKLLDNCPNTQICLEHLVRGATAGVDCAEPPYDDYVSALECAKWPNTTCKVPGLGEIFRKPNRLPVDHPYDSYPPHYEMALKAFGAKRMMWGSNFPPCAAKEGYRNALDGVRKHPIFQNGDDLEWVMGKSAAKLWGFTI